ncbi:MAG: hypothetical protein IJ080_08595 [Oscillospiraceae bacterium]|nr:hypothetical protein [Oscillospiraceae bacterium]
MEMKIYNCTHCGAQYQIGTYKMQGFCEFCGAAYDLSGGTDIRRADPEVIRMLKELMGPVCELEPAEEKLKELENRKVSLEKFIDFNSDPYKRFIIPGAAGICLWIMIALIDGSIGSVFIGLLVGASAFGLTFLCLYLSVKSSSKQYDECLAEIENSRQEIEYYNAVLDKYDLSSIPAKYRNRDAMEFMITALGSGGAYDLISAFQAYEKELARRKELEEEEKRRQHELELEQMRNEQLELQRQLEHERSQTETRVIVERDHDGFGETLGGAILRGAGHEVGRAAGRAAAKAAGNLASSAIKEIMKRR